MAAARSGAREAVAPRQGGLALLVDFDNLFLGLTGTGVPGVTAASMLQALRAAATRVGPLSVARVYMTDAARFTGIGETAAAHEFELVTAAAPRGRSSNVDLVMAMHGQALLLTRSDITTYVLGSGDSDFAPLARAIVDSGKRLIVLCPKAVASTALVSIAHEFIALESLLTNDAPPSPRSSSSKPSRPHVVRSESRPEAGRAPRAASTPPATAPRSLRVFLCHSKYDKPAVRRLYARLQEEEGIRPWLDEKDLLPGQNWKREIRRQVATSDCVLVCVSPQAIRGIGFVHTEIGFAVETAQTQPEGAIFLIPVKFAECELPESLQPFHWVNLFEADGHTLLMRALRSRADAV
jgi:hypothetical protein